jgi:hypothetical protein
MHLSNMLTRWMNCCAEHLLGLTIDPLHHTCVATLSHHLYLFQVKFPSLSA